MPSSIHKCNTVDVLGDDGLFRYGRVVDVADTGLFIDFFCPNRRHKLTPLNQIFLYFGSQDFQFPELAVAFCGPQSTIPVEVLMRETPTGPWIWFPAEVINLARGVAHFAYNVAVAQWSKDGKSYTDVFPTDRVRWRASSEWWEAIGRSAPAGYKPTYPGYSGYGDYASKIWPERVTKWQYVQRCVPLNDDCPLAAAALNELIRSAACLGYAWTGVCVDVADGCFWYIYRQPKHADDSRTVVPNTFKARMTCDTILQKQYHDFDSVLTVRLPPLLASQTVVWARVKDDLDQLPEGLLVDVLSYLDTLKQNELRAVCTKWNGFVQSPPLTESIVIRSCGRDQLENPIPRRLMYLLAAPIFKCLDSTTQRMIVDTRGSSHRLHPGDHAILFDMIRFVAQHRPGIQLAAIYLVGMEERLMLGTVKDAFRNTQCAMHAPDRPRARRYALEGYEFLLDDFVASWKNCPCVAIYLVHCYVHLEYGGKRLVIPVPAARLTMPDNDGCALWDALDAALPVLSDRQLNKMARWLGNHDPLSAAFRMIRKVVCAVQTADPWPSVHYRGKQWCVDGLKGVQLHRLSRITLHFLLELTKFPEFRDSGFPANPSAWCQPGQFVLDD